MVNPNLKGNGWHEFHGYFSSQSNTEERECNRFSVGRLKDNQYHLLGYTPQSLRIYFSSNEESSGDHGVIILPENKKSIADLVQGD